MIANYIRIIYRNLIRSKTYSLINILGLSVGLSVCLIILEYVNFEKSYDQFHPKSNDIYRVIYGYESAGQTQWDAANFAPTAPALKNDFPEVAEYVRITPEYFGIVLNYHENVFEEKKIYYADSTFFNFFGYKLLAGNSRTALREPRSIVLSTTLAEKYFGPKSDWKESTVGQLILVNNKESYTITGIMEDTPANSHLKFNALISFTTFIEENDPSKEWGWNDFYTYIKLNPGVDYASLESKLGSFFLKYKGKDSRDKMVLQPIEDIHLHSNVGSELEANGSSQSVYFLSIIALIILLIAWVNYVNLSTARSENRAKEVGVRKVNGATRGEVMTQLLLEAFLMNFIAVLISLIFMQATIPLVGSLLGKPLVFSLFTDSSSLFSLAVLYVFGSLISGIYPAFILSTFKPIDVFKSGAHSIAKGKSVIRQSLVVFQFIVSIGLIMGTVIIYNQLNFLKSRELGFNHDQTLVVNSPLIIDSEIEFLNLYRQFKYELDKFPEIESVTISSSLPGKLSNDMDINGGFKMIGQDDTHNRSFGVFRVDQDFLEVFKIKMAAGKFFSNDRITTDTQLIGDAPDEVVVVNRKASELLGYSNPSELVGKKIFFGGQEQEREVIGVVENYHHKSLKNNFEPIVMRNRVANTKYISIRLSGNSPANLSQTIDRVNTIWKATYAGSPFLYSFLNEDVNNQYQEEERFSRVFVIFSAFSILIGCLGLFGLVSYSVMVRMKEIGIRKVLGASLSSIMILFSKEFFKLIVIAFIIGIPLAIVVFDKWLENFAYRAPLSTWMFIIPICMVSVFSFASVFAQITKAALKNPVDTLKSE
jgi:putative ABC transport system permease protein